MQIDFARCNDCMRIRYVHPEALRRDRLQCSKCGSMRTRPVMNAGGFERLRVAWMYMTEARRMNQGDGGNNPIFLARCFLLAFAASGFAQPGMVPDEEPPQEPVNGATSKPQPRPVERVAHE